MKNGPQCSYSPSSKFGVTDSGLGVCRTSFVGRRLHQIGTSLRKLVPISRQRKLGGTQPIDDGNLFSYVYSPWASKYIYRSYKNKMQPVDWPTLSPYDQCELNADRLELLWRDELTRQGPQKASFAQATWRFARTRVILMMCVLSLAMLCGLFGQTVVLGRILEYAQSPHASLSEGLTCLMILMILELGRSFLFALMWMMGTRTAVRLKLACMTVLYRKIMRVDRVGNMSTGEFVNVFAADCPRLFKMVLLSGTLAAGPVMLIGGGCYIFMTLGLMGLPGYLVFFSFIPIQYALTRLARYFWDKAVVISDTRVRLVNEVMQYIRLIRMYAWEKPFSENISGIRRQQESLLLIKNFIHSFCISLMPIVPIISTILTIISYVATGNTITAAQAFPISAFYGGQMRQMLSRWRDSWADVMESVITFQRFKRILLLEEILPTVTKPTVETQAVAIQHAEFSYCTSSENDSDSHREGDENGRKGTPTSTNKEDTETCTRFQTDKTLSDITFEVEKGTLVGICGPVGSGKTTLLMAALGRLRITKGRVMRDGSCAYVSQEPWINNATLRGNILFGEPFDAKRFQKAIRVCNLIHDVEMMPDGDQTEIGERGINLSGGQKQRIALARAFYADKDIYFLDDTLSAVDVNVGRNIMNQLILRELRDKTVIFVTHQIQYLNRCDYVYMMRDGRIIQRGTHEDLMMMNQEYALMVNAVSSESNETVDTIPVAGIGNNRVLRDKVDSITTSNENFPVKIVTESGSDSIGDHTKSAVTLVEPENMKEGIATAETYLSYAKGCGRCLSVFWIGLSTLLTIGSLNFTSWWLAVWMKAGGGNVTDPETNVTMMSDNINDNPNFSMYQTVYATCIVLMIGTSVIRSFVLNKTALNASKYFHNNLFEKIISKPITFFDKTPTGRIQNLFSSDLDTVDNKLPATIDLITQNVGLLLFAAISVCVVFPWYILAMIFVGILCYILIQLYRTAVQSLTRLENATRSPILSHISATIQGLDTIHAFNKCTDFNASFRTLVDRSHGFLFMGQIVRRWLQSRMDGLTLLLTGIVTVLLIITKNQISPTLSGLALTYTLYVSSMLQYTVRIVSDCEAQLISVERIDQYINQSETEEVTKKPVVEVQSEWPTSGGIEFRNVCMSYRLSSPLVLNNVSFTIKPGQKIGIVGRTGAGKSSLTIALLRLIEPCSGHIYIDNIDISEIRLDQLRNRVSIIPQDPVLFSGTIRSNLDPFEVYSDLEIWEALEKAKLKERINAIDGQLDATAGFGGDNLSVGERQLLCLTRALLRQPKILILDEATAAVDPETEMAVQKTIKEEFVNSTVLAIAHRLQTVSNCERILVMNDGQVAEFDTPSNLLADERSIFFQMMAAT